MARLRNHPALANEWVELIGTVLVVAAVIVGLIVVGQAIFGAPAGANDLDCRPVITGPYQDYDGQSAVILEVPDYCAADQQVRLVVFALPYGVTALTPQSLDADQTPTVIVDATLQPGVPNTLDPGPLHGCGDLQIDAAPANDDWAGLQVGVVALHNLPGAFTASAEHADDQCKPCTFAVPAPDDALSVSEQHDDAPCGRLTTSADGARGGQTGPVDGSPVLSAATPQDVTPATPPAGVASSEAETTAPPLTVVSASAAPTQLAATGIDIRWVFGAAILLVFSGWLLVLVGPDIFRGKGKRS